MIWSVSTSARFRGTTLPRTVLNGSTLPSSQARTGRPSALALPLADVYEVAGDGGGGGHLGADQVGAAAGPLPALEVAVRGGGAALARQEDVRVHAQAHRAAGLAP